MRAWPVRGTVSTERAEQPAMKLALDINMAIMLFIASALTLLAMSASAWYFSRYTHEFAVQHSDEALLLSGGYYTTDAVAGETAWAFLQIRKRSGDDYLQGLSSRDCDKVELIKQFEDEKRRIEYMLIEAGQMISIDGQEFSLVMSECAAAASGYDLALLLDFVQAGEIEIALSKHPDL